MPVAGEQVVDGIAVVSFQKPSENVGEIGVRIVAAQFAALDQ